MTFTGYFTKRTRNFHKLVRTYFNSQIILEGSQLGAGVAEMRFSIIQSILLAAGLIAGIPAFAQDNGSSLGKLLDQVDTRGGWENVPMGGQNMLPAAQYGAQGMSSMPPAAGGFPGQLLTPNCGFGPSSGMMNPAQMRSLFTRQNLLRVFLGGDMGDFGGGAPKTQAQRAKDASVTGSAESLYQRASDQAAQAEADEQTASKGSGNDLGTRQGAASSAQYHASDAAAAADAADDITYTSTNYAKDYAAKTRDEANRAQAAADRAQYNASIE